MLLVLLNADIQCQFYHYLFCCQLMGNLMGNLYDIIIPIQRYSWYFFNLNTKNFILNEQKSTSLVNITHFIAKTITIVDI